MLDHETFYELLGEIHKQIELLNARQMLIAKQLSLLAKQVALIIRNQNDG